MEESESRLVGKKKGKTTKEEELCYEQQEGFFCRETAIKNLLTFYVISDWAYFIL